MFDPGQHPGTFDPHGKALFERSPFVAVLHGFLSQKAYSEDVVLKAAKRIHTIHKRLTPFNPF